MPTPTAPTPRIPRKIAGFAAGAPPRRHVRDTMPGPPDRRRPAERFPKPRSRDREEALAAALCALRSGIDVEENFRQIVEYFQQPLERFFARRRVPVEQRHDLIQETFLRVYRYIGSFRGECRFGTWVFTIAVNLHRRQQRYAREADISLDDPRTVLDTSLADPSSDPYEEARAGQERDHLWRLVDLLPPQMKRCFELRMCHGLGIGEIAPVVGLARNTVKVHLHRARRRLRELALEVQEGCRGADDSRSVPGYPAVS